MALFLLAPCGLTAKTDDGLDLLSREEVSEILAYNERLSSLFERVEEQRALRNFSGEASSLLQRLLLQVNNQEIALAERRLGTVLTVSAATGILVYRYGLPSMPNSVSAGTVGRRILSGILSQRRAS